MLQHVSEVHSFIWLSSIPIYAYSIFSLSILQLTDIRVVFAFDNYD